MLGWFNDTEHELFRTIGYPVDEMVKDDRTSFVMGEIHFRFIGPAAYGDRITTTSSLAEIRERTLAWNCAAHITATGAAVTEGRATRVYARINVDGKLTSIPLPEEMKKALQEMGTVKHLQINLEEEYE